MIERLRRCCVPLAGLREAAAQEQGMEQTDKQKAQAAGWREHQQ